MQIPKLILFTGFMHISPDIRRTAYDFAGFEEDAETLSLFGAALVSVLVSDLDLDSPLGMGEPDVLPPPRL
jgi:hypothetical protein